MVRHTSHIIYDGPGCHDKRWPCHVTQLHPAELQYQCYYLHRSVRCCGPALGWGCGCTCSSKTLLPHMWSPHSVDLNPLTISVMFSRVGNPTSNFTMLVEGLHCGCDGQYGWELPESGIQSLLMPLLKVESIFIK